MRWNPQEGQRRFDCLCSCHFIFDALGPKEGGGGDRFTQPSPTRVSGEARRLIAARAFVMHTRHHNRDGDADSVERQGQVTLDDDGR